MQKKRIILHMTLNFIAILCFVLFVSLEIDVQKLLGCDE